MALFVWLPLSGGAVADAGRDLAWKYHCVTCHGENGRSTQPRYPNIAGQNAAYLEARLNYFRDEIEPNNRMNGQAAPLSDEDIVSLADHFSAMPR
ncbi:MAG: c-type cytochrome [Pseudomonadales bacterium]|nr:cytochrome c [Pseudomonadales bacterium]NIX07474.1 c-type cytochrome [Pseudomonadales bacterium]